MIFKKKISFLIPTNRNPSTHINKVIENINSFKSQKKYEICVYSQHEIKGENVVWYEEKGCKGPIYGFNYMVKRVEGEYIICLTDDHIFSNTFDLVVDWLESLHTNFKITSLTPTGSAICENPIQGQVLGDSVIDFYCDKFPLIRFPVFHRELLNELDNVIFNEEFFYHAGDIWLGFYLGKKGYNFQVGPTYITDSNPQKNSDFEVEDCIKCKKLIELMMKEQINYNYKLNIA
jgi:hypothetical protein